MKSAANPSRRQDDERRGVRDARGVRRKSVPDRNRPPAVRLAV